MKRTLILSKETAYRAARLGALGENIAPSYLQRAGFNAVRNLNDDQNNHPFADLIAEREGLTYIISVKTRNKFEARSGNLDSRYKLYTPKHARLIEHLAALHNATPAWLAIQIDGERLSIYFGTVEQLHGNKGRRLGPRRGGHCASTQSLYLLESPFDKGRSSSRIEDCVNSNFLLLN
jgi:Holliday junction resolvase